MKEVAGVVVICFLIIAAVCGFVYVVSNDNNNTLSYTCLTKGAQIYDSSTKDGKYTTVWCVKDGVVVP